LTILAVDLLQRDALPQKTVVTTIMANGGVEQALAAWGGKVLRTRVGDRYVVEAMREHGLTVGGESSGHIVLLEHNTTGDALIAALQVLAILVRTGRPLHYLAQVYEEMPESHRQVALEGKPKPEPAVLESLSREAEAQLNGSGRVVIRASGTEPVIRVMVQHKDVREAEKLADVLAERVAAL
jgi:phosphoglucosamine mutase